MPAADSHFAVKKAYHTVHFAIIHAAKCNSSRVVRVVLFVITLIRLCYCCYHTKKLSNLCQSTCAISLEIKINLLLRRPRYMEYESCIKISNKQVSITNTIQFQSIYIHLHLYLDSYGEICQTKKMIIFLCFANICYSFKSPKKIQCYIAWSNLFFYLMYLGNIQLSSHYVK